MSVLGKIIEAMLPRVASRSPRSQEGGGYPVPAGMMDEESPEQIHIPGPTRSTRSADIVSRSSAKRARLASSEQALAANRERLERHGIRVGTELGRGSNGIAFDIGDSRVLKVTADPSEAKSSFKIEGRANRHIARIHQVFKFPGTEIYGIVQERLQPLDDMEKVDVDWSMHVIDRILGKDLGVFWRGWEAVKDEVSKRPDDRFDDEERADAFRTLERYQLPEMMDEVMRRGIGFHDYHSGNIMKRGSDYVIADLGVSKAHDALDPPVLERRLQEREPTADTGDGAHDILYNAEDLLLAHKDLLIKNGIRPVKRLGNGAMGVAFETADGRVLKVTTDASEAVSSLRIQGRDLPGVVRIERVFRFPLGNGGRFLGAYGVLQEKLRPLDPTTKKMLRWANLTVEALFDKQMFCYTRGWDNFIHEVAKAMRQKRYDAHKVTELQKAIQVYKRLNLHRMMDGLFGAGVLFYDYHVGNIMMGDKGAVVTDLGVSRVQGGGEQPPTLESVIIETLSDRVSVVHAPLQPFSKAQADFVRRLARRGKAVLLLRRGPVGFAAMREVVKASLPELEGRVELFDVGDMDLGRALDHAEQAGSEGLRPRIAMEVYCPDDEASARESLSSSGAFSDSTVLVRPLDPALAVDERALSSVRSGDIEGVMDPHVFSDRARARRVADLLRDPVGEIVETTVSRVIPKNPRDHLSQNRNKRIAAAKKRITPLTIRDVPRIQKNLETFSPEERSTPLGDFPWIDAIADTREDPGAGGGHRSWRKDGPLFRSLRDFMHLAGRAVNVMVSVDAPDTVYGDDPERWGVDATVLVKSGRGKSSIFPDTVIFSYGRTWDTEQEARQDAERVRDLIDRSTLDSMARLASRPTTHRLDVPRPADNRDLNKPDAEDSSLRRGVSYPGGFTHEGIVREVVEATIRKIPKRDHLSPDYMIRAAMKRLAARPGVHGKTGDIIAVLDAIPEDTRQRVLASFPWDNDDSDEPILLWQKSGGPFVSFTGFDQAPAPAVSAMISASRVGPYGREQGQGFFTNATVWGKSGAKPDSFSDSVVMFRYERPWPDFESAREDALRVRAMLDGMTLERLSFPKADRATTHRLDVPRPPERGRDFGKGDAESSSLRRGVNYPGGFTHEAVRRIPKQQPRLLPGVKPNLSLLDLLPRGVESLPLSKMRWDTTDVWDDGMVTLSQADLDPGDTIQTWSKTDSMKSPVTRTNITIDVAVELHPADIYNYYAEDRDTTAHQVGAWAMIRSPPRGSPYIWYTQRVFDSPAEAQTFARNLVGWLDRQTLSSLALQKSSKVTTHRLDVPRPADNRDMNKPDAADSTLRRGVSYPGGFTHESTVRHVSKNAWNKDGRTAGMLDSVEYRENALGKLPDPKIADVLLGTVPWSEQPGAGLDHQRLMNGGYQGWQKKFDLSGHPGRIVAVAITISAGDDDDDRYGDHQFRVSAYAVINAWPMRGPLKMRRTWLWIETRIYDEPDEAVEGIERAAALIDSKTLRQLVHMRAEKATTHRLDVPRPADNRDMNKPDAADSPLRKGVSYPGGFVHESLVREIVGSLVERKTSEWGGSEGATKVIELNHRALAKYVDFESIEYLGEGEHSVVFDIGRGRVLKVTGDIGDASSAQALKGKTLKHISRVYEVFELESDGDLGEMFAIIGEKVDVLPPDGEESNELNRAFQIVRELPDNERLYGLLAAGQLDQFFDGLRQGLARDAMAELGRGRSEPEKQRQRVLQIVERKARELWDVMRKYSVTEMVRELNSVGVRFVDFKGDNLGKRGGDYVLLDVGGRSPMRRPPRLGRTETGPSPEVAQESLGGTGGMAGGHMAGIHGRSQSSPWSTGKVTEPVPPDRLAGDEDDEESALARQRLGHLVTTVMAGLAGRR